MMVQTWHTCEKCGQRRTEKHLRHVSCIHGGWWQCRTVRSCRIRARNARRAARRLGTVQPAPGDLVHSWPDPGDPWPFTGTVEAVDGADVTIRWDHLPAPVVHHGPTPHLTFLQSGRT